MAAANREMNLVSFFMILFSLHELKFFRFYSSERKTNSEVFARVYNIVSNFLHIHAKNHYTPSYS